MLVDPVTPAGSGAGHSAGCQAEGWTVVMPLKASGRGKSRIDLDPDLRRRLVLVMAADTVAAVARAHEVARVLLVLEDAADGAAVRSALAAAGSAPRVTVETHVTSARSLNEAIGDGIDHLGPSVGPVAVLPCDVPSATAAEIDTALAAARRHGRAVVADADGTGTTLLAAVRTADLRPRYGPDSWRRHVADGAVPVDLPADSGLRRDVDLRADLATVTGPGTRRTWRASRDGAA